MHKSKQDYVFKCSNGKTYGVAKDGPQCLVCEHCTDVYYDYTNGPYMWFCEYDIKDEDSINCKFLKLEEGVLTLEEYEKLPEEKNKKIEYDILNDLFESLSEQLSISIMKKLKGE